MPRLFLGTAELPSSLLHRWAHSTHTHARTALGEPRMPRPGRHNRGPRALWIPGVPGDRVSAVAARRWQCGDTRVCPDTGGSGWSGTCGDRVGGWSMWGAGTGLTAPGALFHPSRLLVVLFHHTAELQQTPRDPRGAPPPSGPQFPHLEGSASTEKGPLMWTAFRLFSNMP